MGWEKREKLGEILLAEGVISVEDLQLALRKQRETKMRLGEVLVSLGAISEERLLYYLGEQLGISSIELERYYVDEETLGILEEGFIRENEILPLFVEGDSLHCAMVDPLETGVVEQVQSKTGLTPQVSICSRKAMALCISVNFPDSEELPDEDVDEDLVGAGRAVRRLMFEMRKENCTELQMEGKETRISIRLGGEKKFRTIDGTMLGINRSLLSSIWTYLRHGTNNDRKAAEGLCVIRVGKNSYAVRVNILNTLQGESLGIRLVDRARYWNGLKGADMNDQDLQRCVEFLKENRGLILVVAPPGGTNILTMYAMLRHLSEQGRSIYLIEESPQDVLDFANQVVVNGRNGSDIRQSLNSVMNHSPEVIAIGGSPDGGLLKSILADAAQSSLVITTLSAGDFSEAWIRLCSMTGDPETLSLNLVGVVSQRSFQAQCPGCTQNGGRREGTVCPVCNNTGFDKPSIFYQVVKLDEDLKKPLTGCYDSPSVNGILRQQGVKTFEEILAAADPSPDNVLSTLIDSAFYPDQ